ncbi:MAG: thiamine-phosphate kinase [Myxococcales bacterium]
MASEFERIALLQKWFQRDAGERVALGIGDDAAVLNPSSRNGVWTVDSAVEGVHFSRAFMGLEDIGYRAFMAAASDVAAMGGRAVGALCAWVLPEALSDAEFEQLSRGVREAADTCECAIIGGNLARGRELSLTTTVLGECHGPVALRSGARVGDTLFVTGPLGAAALGLRALQRGSTPDVRFEACRTRFLRPRARLDIAEKVAARARACIDVSDGLAQDLHHLCSASGVSAVVELDALPRPAGMAQLAQELGVACEAMLLSGGEDYELLFTANQTRVPPELGIPIGRIEAGDARITVLDTQGNPVALPAGFDHFR